jgi:phospholipid/cholesterol/gamma-HCH transport system substrate-binding protein
MSTAAKVGAFFLVALVLTGALIWKIEDLQFGRRSTKILTAQFNDVAGLKEKSDVRVAGVVVGRVGKIRLVGGKALVDLELDRDIELRQGASAAIQSLGVLGDNYVELVPGPVGAVPLPQGSMLRGNEPVSFDQVTRLARGIETDLQDITKSLKATLGGASNEQRLNSIVDNVLEMSKELRKVLESNRASIDATTSNFRDFSSQMSRLVDRIDRLVAANEGNVTEGIQNAKDLSSKLQATVDNMNAITGKINSGKGAIGQLVESDETTKNLNDALVAVKEGVNSMTSALTTVKKLNFDLGLREEYLTGPGKGKGYFTVQIQPTGKPRFYLLELSSQPFGVRKDTATITTTVFPDGHVETTRQDVTEFRGNTFAISAEVGWRYGNVVGRAGIIESSGGIGLDYLGLKDRLRLSAELFGFNRDNLNAHGKISGRYYFSPSVYLVGGWDDIFNTKAKADSFFFGAGVRWGDDDVKFLAGSVPH